MAKVKLTKTELKAQKDALSRYQKFLPMLQLKKSQLQMELGGMRARAADLARREEELLEGVKPWIGLLADAGVPLSVELERVRTHAGNIAGVEIPVYDGVDLRRAEVDLFATPEWVDDAAAAAAALIGVRAERDVAAEQVRLIAEELRTTSQRVNLFEKVKIPECRENIRVINVAIGDEQTSAVARGKIAKSRGAKTSQDASRETQDETPARDLRPETFDLRPSHRREDTP
ncbi:MAG: V-type ATP synthase subunit D [Kiritimatiellae bacterium]|nr:V-type ATP synthase subunit D [Kiritimatiellia bacterium]